MMTSRLLLGLSLLFVPASQKPKTPDAKMRITLSIFSGREDPTWALTEAQDRRFVASFDALPASDSKKPLYENLGYRGFRITGFRDYDQVAVWNGIVQATRGQKTTRWYDKGRALERLLLETSKDHIEEATYKGVAAEVDKE